MNVKELRKMLGQYPDDMPARIALLQDAMRYRYLRDAGDSDLCVRGEEEPLSPRSYEATYYREMIYGAQLNAAIDAAIAATKEPT